MRPREERTNVIEVVGERKTQLVYKYMSGKEETVLVYALPFRN